jgi:hypothetical protein
MFIKKSQLVVRWSIQNPGQRTPLLARPVQGAVCCQLRKATKGYALRSVISAVVDAVVGHRHRVRAAWEHASGNSTFTTPSANVPCRLETGPQLLLFTQYKSCGGMYHAGIINYGHIRRCFHYSQVTPVLSTSDQPYIPCKEGLWKKWVDARRRVLERAW